MLQPVAEIRFAVGSTARAHPIPDIYAPPMSSWISEVGAPIYVSLRTAAQQPAAQRTPAEREVEGSILRATHATTLGIQP